MVDSKKNYKFDLGVKGLSDRESKTKVETHLALLLFDSDDMLLQDYQMYKYGK